ncbi:MAG: mechanosensitive ion channel family protein [Cyanobacteriota bacterium]|nr:mechanosensitive ion channel family protein [Cyanobacteriota bacterium]
MAVALLILSTPLIACEPVHGQPTHPYLQTQPDNRIDGFPVMLDGREILSVRRAIAGFSAQERAQTISRRLYRIAQNESIAVDQLTIQRNADDHSVFLSVGPEVVLTITEQDAKARRSTPEALAKQVLPIIKAAIGQYRQDREPRQLARHSLYAVIGSMAFLGISTAIIKSSGRLFLWLVRLIATRVPGIQVKNVEIISPATVASFWLQVLKLLRLTLLVILFFFYTTFILRLFPWSRAVGESVMEYFYQSLELVLSATANYLPNLFIVAIIGMIAYYMLRILKPGFRAIERGTLVIPGFYADWARPTYNLLVILVLALAAVLAFPYLPGFNSPAFQGVTVFLGLLLSLGSTSAITNVVGGVILIYTRAFRIGDHIRIGDVVGDIIETNFLAVRICTPSNQVITIPNSTLLSNKVVNYNISSRDLNRSLILQSSVTLGYDVPWRKAHATLIAAALTTEHILQEPAPFILQTSLDNDHVSYQLNAYTDDPNRMVFIYSQLHQSIQDKCKDSGIEILSPNYTALRDGNRSTIPQDDVAKDDGEPSIHQESLSSPPAER